MLHRWLFGATMYRETRCHLNVRIQRRICMLSIRGLRATAKRHLWLDGDSGTCRLPSEFSVGDIISQHARVGAGCMSVSSLPRVSCGISLSFLLILPIDLK